MTQGWDADNKLVPITVVEAGENVITQIKNLEKTAMQQFSLHMVRSNPAK